MGQRVDVFGVGAGTVRIGREVSVEMGGWGLVVYAIGDGGGDRGETGCCCGCGCVCGADEERETVFAGRWLCGRGAVCEGATFLAVGIPDMIGGGRSNPSAAFRDNCLAKSEACHHSRNLRAKIEVGRRRRRLDSKRG